jgi:protocatechuate 3,4-dioxygenase beta subunit
MGCVNRDLNTELTRRRLLQLGLVVPIAGVAAAYGRSLPDAADGAAAPLATTPACDDGDDPTPAQTEGPYFTPDSPRRRSLLEAGDAGTRLTLTGYVLTTSCRPVRRALIDFWQANARGAYDNQGYRFRGHQFTDSAGRYRLETVVPGLYPGRTRHIHVKVQAPGEPVLTTQLYFPGEPRNRADSIFDRDLLLSRWRKAGGRRLARFDFVLDLD